MERWFLSVPPEKAMRVPDDWLNAVFFLAIDRVGKDGSPQPEYAGTGFYFAVQNEQVEDLRRLYFVTARRCIEESRKAAGKLYVRLNTEAGGSILAPVSKTSWTFHRNPSIDVAVLAPTFALASEHALPHTYIEADACVTPDVSVRYDIGVGSDVTAIGLFGPRQGTDRNIPVVRAGVIAAMAGEPIYDGTPHEPHEGYLVELLSIGGLSGSPVFVHPTAGPHHIHPREPLSGGRVKVSTQWNQHSFVLGMVRSHWDERPSGALKNLPRREWISRGIAAVTPISGVVDVLSYRKFKDQRKRDAETARKRNGAILD
jgi:hypothetical protein